LNAGAEDFIVKPLQSKDVQRLRSCSTARSNKGSAPREAVAKRTTPMPPPSDQHHAAAASASVRRGHFAGVAMVRTPPPAPALAEENREGKIFIMRFAAVAAGPALVERGALAVLAAARQARPAGVRRAVPGPDPAQMVVRRWPLAVPVMRLSPDPEQQQWCRAVLFR